MASVGPSARPNLLLITVVFVLSRSVILPFQQPTSDVGIYARYVHEMEVASLRGEPFYAYHAREVERQAEAARADGTLRASIDEYKAVEYPPLALAVMALPRVWMGERPPQGPLTPEFEASYRAAYRLGLAGVDVALFALLVALVRRWYGRESGREQTQRLLVYVASTFVLWHLLYDRLDLIQTLLVMLGLACLLGRPHYLWSFLLLDLAINFKLVPLVLAPVWVAGSLPVERWVAPWPRVLASLALRTLLLVGLAVAVFLPFAFTAGNESLGFLSYHRGRPLEINSLAASLLLVPRLFGEAVPVEYSYGSINVSSPLAPTVAALVPWLAAALLLAASALLLVHCRKLAKGGLAGRRLAQSYPHDVICLTLLFLMLFIATNKVFSTQYLLWLAPLVALVPIEGRGRRPFFLAFVLTCALSTLLVPFLFVMDLVDPEAAVTVPRTFRDPTARLVAFLLTRNVLFAALAAVVAVHLWRRKITAYSSL